VIRARDGASVGRTSVPAQSVSDRLTAYPKDMLSSPLDVGSASADVLTGATDGAPPTLAGARLTGAVHVSGASSTGFAALVAREQLSLGIVFLSLLVAMFWGAAHALTPGHGKAVVAAYLVGTRGRARDAFALGGVVTLTHTVGVFALGLVTIGLSEFVVPEDLYPGLPLVSSLLVVAVGVAVLRARVASARRRGCHSHHHHGHNDHEHVHAHVHAHGSGSKHHGAADHGHSHAPPPGTGWRGLVVAGVSGGLLPCPTALVVLLAAISLHRVAFGMLLILAFSTGLALVVTAIGLLAIGSRRVFDRVSLDGGLVRALPAFSAVVIVAVGVAMTVRSLPAVT
jgi:ABC-type nickel/cobalt efflux system permease component RcnA